MKIEDRQLLKFFDVADVLKKCTPIIQEKFNIVAQYNDIGYISFSERDKRKGIFDPGSLNIVINNDARETVDDIFMTLFHELRHVWQYSNDGFPGIMETWNQEENLHVKTRFSDSPCCIPEVDAHIFGASFGSVDLRDSLIWNQEFHDNVFRQLEQFCDLPDYFLFGIRDSIFEKAGVSEQDLCVQFPSFLEAFRDSLEDILK